MFKREADAPLRHLCGLPWRSAQNRVYQVQVQVGWKLAPAGHDVHVRHIGRVPVLPGNAFVYVSHEDWRMDVFLEKSFYFINMHNALKLQT